MNIRRCFIIGILLCGIGILNAQVVITSEAEQRAKEIVAKMTLKEKLRYISGYTADFQSARFPVWDCRRYLWQTVHRVSVTIQKVRCIHPVFCLLPLGIVI